MEDEVSWKLRVRHVDEEVRKLCVEAVRDGRLDRLEQLTGELFDLRQQSLEVLQVARNGVAATKPYPWWAREWMRTLHWLLCAELFAREQRMTRIRTRLMGPDRDVALMERREDEPRTLLGRFTCWLFSLTP